MDDNMMELSNEYRFNLMEAREVEDIINKNQNHLIEVFQHNIENDLKKYDKSYKIKNCYFSHFNDNLLIIETNKEIISDYIFYICDKYGLKLAYYSSSENKIQFKFLEVY